MMYLGESNLEVTNPDMHVAMTNHNATEGPGWVGTPTFKMATTGQCECLIAPCDVCDSAACKKAQKKAADAATTLGQLASQVSLIPPNLSAIAKLPAAQKAMVKAVANAKKVCENAAKKQQTQVQTTTPQSFDFSSFFQDHKSWFIYGGVAIVGVLILSSVFGNDKRRQNPFDYDEHYKKNNIPYSFKEALKKVKPNEKIIYGSRSKKFHVIDKYDRDFYTPNASTKKQAEKLGKSGIISKSMSPYYFK